MNLVKFAVVNGVITNIIDVEEKHVKNELINLFIDKFKKRYKIKFDTDNIKRQVKASLKFNDKGKKIEYIYYFSNIDNSINLL